MHYTFVKHVATLFDVFEACFMREVCVANFDILMMDASDKIKEAYKKAQNRVAVYNAVKSVDALMAIIDKRKLQNGDWVNLTDKEKYQAQESFKRIESAMSKSIQNRDFGVLKKECVNKYGADAYDAISGQYKDGNDQNKDNTKLGQFMRRNEIYHYIREGLSKTDTKYVEDINKPTLDEVKSIDIKNYLKTLEKYHLELDNNFKVVPDEWLKKNSSKRQIRKLMKEINLEPNDKLKSVLETKYQLYSNELKGKGLHDIIVSKCSRRDTAESQNRQTARGNSVTSLTKLPHATESTADDNLKAQLSSIKNIMGAYARESSPPFQLEQAAKLIKQQEEKLNQIAKTEATNQKAPGLSGMQQSIPESTSALIQQVKAAINDARGHVDVLKARANEPVVKGTPVVDAPPPTRRSSM